MSGGVCERVCWVGVSGVCRVCVSGGMPGENENMFPLLLFYIFVEMKRSTFLKHPANKNYQYNIMSDLLRRLLCFFFSFL